MKVNITKNYVNSIMTVIFCLMILAYGQGGYAGFEKSLYKDRVGQEYIDIGVYDTIITKKMVGEIIKVLTNREHSIGMLQFARVSFEPGVFDLIIQAILQMDPTLRCFFMGRGFDTEVMGEQAVLDILRMNKMLTVIDINNCSFSNEFLGKLADILLTENRKLTELRLSFINIDDKGSRAIAEILRRSKTLVSLVLYGSQISKDGRNIIIEALEHNITIQDIDFNADTGTILTTTQKEIIELILKRNKLIKHISEKIVDLINNIGKIMLLGIHPRVGEVSPLNILNGAVLREILTAYHEDEVYNIIMYGTESQLRELTVEEHDLIEKIRAIQREIIERIRSSALIRPLTITTAEHAVVMPTPIIEGLQRERGAQLPLQYFSS